MVNINGLHKNTYQKPLDGSEENLENTTPHNEHTMSDDHFSRSKSLAVGSQIKKPQLAKSSFNLKDKTPTLPHKINYSGYGLN